jgi:hypothetical protein
MALKLSVGLSKKVGLPNYGSLGATCGIEVELDTTLFHEDPHRFQNQVHEAFSACQQAVESELNRLQSEGSTDRVALYPARPEPSRPNRRPPRPITPAQLNALNKIARHRGIHLDTYAAEQFGVSTCNQLTLAQASRLIDELRTTSIAS